MTITDGTLRRPMAKERLAAMSTHSRRAAYERGELDRAELQAWALVYPEEVPLLNDELPWIAANLE